MATWTPTAAEIHAIMPTRNAGAVWTSTSIPTLAEVNTLALQVSAEIVGKLVDVGGSAAVTGTDITAQAKWANILGAAAWLELGGFPEQQPDEFSVAPTLFRRYDEAVGALRRMIELGGATYTAASRQPTYSFPDAWDTGMADPTAVPMP